MLTTTYPAKHSYFVNEDAIIRRYKIWDTLKTLLTRPCYPFEIVYTDGLISYVAADGKSREAYGVLIGPYIIPMHAPAEEMTVGQAMIHCNNIVFAQRKAVLPNIMLLRHMRSNQSTLNKVFDAFDGDMFQEGAYISDTGNGWNSHAAINFARGGLFQCSIDREKNEKAYCRPVIDISDLN